MARKLSVGVLLALWVGFAARVYRLGDANLWYDEGWSVFMARQSLPQLLEQTARDVHPPLYFMVLSGWRALAGESEFSLRFPSVLFGALLIALGFRLARTWFGASAGILAAWLLAVQGAGIWYSQEIRMYALSMLLALVALGSATDLVATGRWRAWAALTITLALGLHTLYLFVLVPAALSLAILGLIFMPGLPARKRLIAQWGSALIVAGALFLPWLRYAAALRPERFADGGVADVGGLITLWLNTLLIGNAVFIDTYWPVYLAALGIVTGAVMLSQTDARRRTEDGQKPSGRPVARLFLLLAALDGILVTLALVWLLSLPLGLNFNFVPTARYLITLVPWATLALGAALAIWQARWPRAGLALSVIAVASAAYFATGRYADRVLMDTFRSAARTWQAYRQPGDDLVMHTHREWPLVDYYLGQTTTTYLPAQVFVADAATAERYLAPSWNAHEAVWLFLTEDALQTDWERHVWRWLNERALASRSFDYPPDAQLWVFARTAERAATLDILQIGPEQPLDLAVADGVRWLGIDRPLPEASIGEQLQVVTYWQTSAPTTPSFALRLTSVWGGTVADEIPLALPPATERARVETAFPIRPYLSPGAYRLQLTRGPGSAALGPDLGTVTVVGVPAPPPGQPLPGAPAELFENGLQIRGWRGMQHGRVLEVSFTYLTARFLDQRWKRFVHLIGADGRRWAQVDDEPLDAKPPMTAWMTDQLIADTAVLRLPPDLAPGTYMLVTGFYHPLSGARLPVITPEGAVVSDTISLGPIEVGP